MGHLDNIERVIEAKLTSLGRKRLAEGEGLDITQFALADDEVDYGLWQDDLPDEDAGAIIENLPTYEAFTDESQSMRHKLITLEPNSDSVPFLSAGSLGGGVLLEYSNRIVDNDLIETAPLTVSPQTQITRQAEPEETDLDDTLGYTAILHDSSIAAIEVAEGGEVDKDKATVPAIYGREEIRSNPNLQILVGTEFLLGWDRTTRDANGNLNVDETQVSNESTTLTLIGNATGLSTDIEVTVSP